MAKRGRKLKPNRVLARDLERLHHELVQLYDELIEANAWTAFVCDGICGILADQQMDKDSATHNGMRFATIWLKQRNRTLAASLHAACTRMHQIRRGSVNTKAPEA